MIELWGVFEGLHYVRCMECRAVEVNIDSKIIVDILNGQIDGCALDCSLVGIHIKVMRIKIRVMLTSV
jgi:ribonuclease HI